MQKDEWYFKEIANGIIAQAADDYRNALDGRGYENRTAGYVVKEIERFFRSSYFRILTKVDGEYLIEQIRKEHEDKIAKEVKK